MGMFKKLSGMFKKPIQDYKDSTKKARQNFKSFVEFCMSNKARVKRIKKRRK